MCARDQSPTYSSTCSAIVPVQSTERISHLAPDITAILDCSSHNPTSAPSAECSALSAPSPVPRGTGWWFRHAPRLRRRMQRHKTFESYRSQYSSPCHPLPLPLLLLQQMRLHQPPPVLVRAKYSMQPTAAPVHVASRQHRQAIGRDATMSLSMQARECRRTKSRITDSRMGASVSIEKVDGGCSLHGRPAVVSATQLCPAVAPFSAGQFAYGREKPSMNAKRPWQETRSECNG